MSKFNVGDIIIFEEHNFFFVLNTAGDLYRLVSLYVGPYREFPIKALTLENYCELCTSIFND